MGIARRFYQELFVFSIIMVWWFECGIILWLCCDGSEVVFVNVVNAYKSKKLQRNVKQKID